MPRGQMLGRRGVWRVIGIVLSQWWWWKGWLHTFSSKALGRGVGSLQPLSIPPTIGRRRRGRSASNLVVHGNAGVFHWGVHVNAGVLHWGVSRGLRFGRHIWSTFLRSSVPSLVQFGVLPVVAHTSLYLGVYMAILQKQRITFWVLYLVGVRLYVSPDRFEIVFAT